MVKAEKLMPSKIKATWAGLHASDKQALIQSKEAGSQTKAHNHRETVVLSKFPTHHHSISVDGEQFEVDIPDMVKSVFDKEFGSLDEEAKQTDVLKSRCFTFRRIFGCSHFHVCIKRRRWQPRWWMG